MEQRHPAIASDQQIGPAIAIVVRDHAAVTIEGNAIEADLSRDIAKLPVAEVLVEPAGVSLDLLLLGAVEVTAAGDEQIQQAIAVVVKQAHAAAQ